MNNTHKNGIRIICYFLLHQLFEKDKQENPDWIQEHLYYSLGYGTLDLAAGLE